MDPGGAPMCADKAAMEWAKAWKSKGPAPQKLGFIYMLNGDNGTSNTDPFATEETRDNNWIKTGSHVMIVGAEAKSMMQCKACLGLFKHFQRWNIFSGMDLGPAVARF